MKKSVSLFALAGLLCLAAQAAERPNVVLIVTDDYGYGITTSYGGDSQWVATPNIARIGSEGALFTEAYVTCSVCGPSRAGIMTGRYPQRFGYYTNQDAQQGGVPADQSMMAGYFKQAGYATAMVGKWHLGSKEPGQHPLDKGFDEYFGFDNAQTDYFKSPILYDGRQKVKKHDYLTRAFTDRAVDFMQRSADKPFFLYLAYNAVHGPTQAPQESIERHPDLPKQDAVRVAMVDELDGGVGRVLASLKKLGLEDNTLVFFLSDNGGLPVWWEGSNGNLRGFKRAQFDGGVKVPFMVRWPRRIPAGQTRDRLTISLDILPTALAASGIAVPSDEILDGINLLPDLESAQDVNPKRPLFWAGSHFDKATSKTPGIHMAGPPPSWAVRRGPWKLIQIMEMGPPMLFNIEVDPAETTNVIAQHPETASKLKVEFCDWFKTGTPPIGWKQDYYEQLKNVK